VARDLIQVYGYASPLYAAVTDWLADSEGTTRNVVTFNIIFVALLPESTVKIYTSNFCIVYSVDSWRLRICKSN
jgi:hypothetical protein